MKTRKRHAMILRDYRGFGVDNFRGEVWWGIETSLGNEPYLKRERGRRLRRKLHNIIYYPPQKAWVTQWDWGP